MKVLNTLLKRFLFLTPLIYTPKLEKKMAKSAILDAISLQLIGKGLNTY